MLITRPQPAASETARRVAALGLDPVVAPVLSVSLRPVRFPATVQAVLVTSGNALAGLPAAYFPRPLLTVGDATAARAEKLGFMHVVSAGRDAAALASLTAQNCQPGGDPLLLACGEGQGRALATALRRAGFRVVRRVVYAAEAVEKMPEAARAALVGNQLRAVLFFSPATARSFVTLLRRDMSSDCVAGIEALAISRPTASALAPLPWRRIRVASHPNQDELLALLQ